MTTSTSTGGQLFRSAREGSARARRASQRRPPLSKRREGLLLISPWLAGLLLFNLLPTLSSLALSLTDFFLLRPSETQFVGAANYLAVLRDEQTWGVLAGTFRFALIIIPLQTAASIALAAVLSHPKLRLRNTLRALFFFPSIIPAPAAAYMWMGFVNPLSGWLTGLLLAPLGLEAWNVFYTRGPGEALFILSSLWTIGPGTLIMLGAMQGIPEEVLEAAHIDGAGRLRRFFSITLPMISPAVFFSLIINLTAVFGGAMLLDRGFAFSTSFSSYDDYVNYVLFDLFRLGYASGLAWIFFVLVMLVVVLLFASSKYWVHFPDREQ
jgi:multiple sugar transport system permease protein